MGDGRRALEQQQTQALRGRPLFDGEKTERHGQSGTCRKGSGPFIHAAAGQVITERSPLANAIVRPGTQQRIKHTKLCPHRAHSPGWRSQTEINKVMRAEAVEEGGGPP